MTVRVLPQTVVNQISAGEVVDRPASVVRELVDNAIDAGATEVTVTLAEGGKSLIQIVDDGCGMRRDDALLAFERYATSKISSIDDLFRLNTLGFRGEALPSIASVSRLTLRTRPKNEEIGTEIRIDGGEVVSNEPAACAVGSEFTVRNLFFNTPARKKFLKQPATEEQKVKQWLTQAALTRPGVRYRLIADDRELINLPRRSDLFERGRDMFRGSLVSFEQGDDRLRVRGMIGHPGSAEGNSNSFIVTVNGRLVSDRTILRAVKDGFGGTLKAREFPLGFISIDIDPAEVDVNVHPQKSEVRFRVPQLLYGFVHRSISGAINQFSGPVRAVSFETGMHTSGGLELVSSMNSQTNAATGATGATGAATTPQNLSLFQSAAADRSVDDSSIQADFHFSELAYVGKVLGCYLMCELRGDLVVVDMHAAHERLNFNDLRNRFRERASESQGLLLPVVVEAPERTSEELDELIGLLTPFGFEIELFGNDSVIIRAVPSVVGGLDVEHFISELCAEELSAMAASRYEELIDQVAARIACHASIRSGYEINRTEVEALFRSLDSAEFSAACPHGRPIVVSFPRYKVEGWFGRDK